jgi:hypothetical protein
MFEIVFFRIFVNGDLIKVQKRRCKIHQSRSKIRIEDPYVLWKGCRIPLLYRLKKGWMINIDVGGWKAPR